jgi:hypothetical protein
VEQEFVGRAEVGPPPDASARRARQERALGVQHHHGAAGHPVVTQLPARGDEHRLANIIERDAMSRGQRLDRGDAWDHVVVDVEVLRDGVQDSQCAVVQRRVAPRQECPDAVRLELGFDGLGPDPGARRVPVRDGLPVVAVLGARWIGQFDEPVAALADESVADLPTQRYQVVGPGPFVHREEHLGVVERLDCLRRHIVGIACADADDVDPSGHAASMPHDQRLP